jgi:segregation and condensation protein B
MSLKARIEAVIYAAEEPVTLAQLASLFRDEALAARAARLSAPSADPEAPGEPDGASTNVLASLLGESSASGLLPSEPAAQDSADAEVATRDFGAQPQTVAEPPGEAADSESASDAGLVAQRETQSADRAGPPPAGPAVLAGREGPDRARDRDVRDEIRRLLDELIAGYNTRDSGIEIREVAGGYRFATRPECHDAVRAFIKTLKPPFKLSLQALETLAVIAYKQPITAPEIGEIRGVDSSGVLGSLIARKLITTAGRKQVVGRPILYKTTREFLLRFGLKDVGELPSLDEFEKMASELAEAEDAEPIAPGEEELPFAQNEAAAIEEDPSLESAEESPSTQDSTSSPDVAVAHADRHQP